MDLLITLFTTPNSIVAECFERIGVTAAKLTELAVLAGAIPPCETGAVNDLPVRPEGFAVAGFSAELSVRSLILSVINRIEPSHNPT